MARDPQGRPIAGRGTPEERAKAKKRRQRKRKEQLERDVEAYSRKQYSVETLEKEERKKKRLERAKSGAAAISTSIPGGAGKAAKKIGKRKYKVKQRTKGY